MKTLICGDREVHLRYPARTHLSIRDTAAKIIGAGRLERIDFKPIDNKVPIEVVAMLINEIDIMLWLFGKGLDWSGSGAKPEDAADLYDAYMEVPDDELDTGERLEAFQTAIGEAIAASRGMNLKKTIEKRQAEQAKLKANANQTIEDLKDSTSTSDGNSAAVN